MITLHEVYVHKEKNNDSIWLLAQKTKQLIRLHNKVYEEISCYFVDEINRGIFYKAPSIPEWWKSN